MSGWRIGALALGAGTMAAACSGQDGRITQSYPVYGGSYAPPSTPSDGDMGGAPGVPTHVGGAPPALQESCGNGIWEVDEVCDPSAPGFESCADLGFDAGTSSCTASCTLDVRDCTYEDASQRPENVCGDGYLDGDEECEDGNLESNDGCSGACELESSEHEPNNSDLEAEDYLVGLPFFGMLETDDEDWLRVLIEEPPAQLVASVSDLLPTGCSDDSPGVNPALELVDAFGDPIAWDSDSGPGECALLQVNNLGAGVYYLRITAEMSGTFAYVLDVAVD